jgi:hypothetical protein
MVNTNKEAMKWIIENFATSWEENRPQDNAQWGVCVSPDASKEPVFAYGMTLSEAVNNAITQIETV